MATWCCYLDNETGDTLSLSGYSLNWGSWRAKPKATIDTGHDATFESETDFIGKNQGWVNYSGPRGWVSISWDDPIVGSVTRTVRGSGVYTVREMGTSPGEAQEDGGVMIRIEAKPVVIVAPVAPAPKAAPGTPAKVDVSTKGHLYTTNANEREVHTTKATIPEVATALKADWAELTETGAHVLTAQWAGETGGGKSCFNWNLGNVKAGSDKVKHMYLQRTYERFPDKVCAEEVKKGKGLAALATAEQIKKRSDWAPNTKTGTSVVVYTPPHPTSRFLAYDSLAEGAEKWINRHKGYAAKNKDYLAALNAADTTKVAHILGPSGFHYYTDEEARYAASLAAQKKKVDAAVLAATPKK